MKRTIKAVTGRGKLSTLAVFTLDDGKVTAEWRSDVYREDMEHGLLTRHGLVTMDDGDAFWEALAAECSRCSKIVMIDAQS